jgi:hypothetical protein
MVWRSHGRTSGRRRALGRTVYIWGLGVWFTPGSLKKPTSDYFIPMSNAPSPQAQLIYELGRGFRERNLDIVAKIFHRDSRHVAYPRSLNIPEQSVQEYIDFVGKRIRYWTEVEQVGH